MSGPWFRKYLLLSRVPITWQGWAVTIAALLSTYGLMQISFDEPNATLRHIEVAAWFAILIGFFGLVEWKLERDYGGGD